MLETTTKRKISLPQRTTLICNSNKSNSNELVKVRQAIFISQAGNSKHERKCWRQTQRKHSVALSTLLSLTLLILIQSSLPSTLIHGSLIVGDSAIEIKEFDHNEPQSTSSGQQMQSSADAVQVPQQDRQPQSADPTSSSLILGSLNDPHSIGQLYKQHIVPEVSQQTNNTGRQVEQTDFAQNSATPIDNSQLSEAPLQVDLQQQYQQPEQSSIEAKPVTNGAAIKPVFDGSKSPPEDVAPETGRTSLTGDSTKNERKISGSVVDFELEHAGGHNKAKIKKKKKKKKEGNKEWKKKKSKKKKMFEEKKKKGMKKKHVEGVKKKKKFGEKIEAQKKKGEFKKKKFGENKKKGEGVKKGNKGHKKLEDKGHKSSGFKTVYHKEEYGQNHKWHDIKRDKKWDSKKKKWKKTWKKEKGKKYHGEHKKKFLKAKKNGKKYLKKSDEKFKKEKGEKYKKGHKKKMEKMSKKEEGGKKAKKKKKKKKAG